MKKLVNKILITTLLAVLVGLLGTNLSAFAMHHMDASDCVMPNSCDNGCICTAIIPSNDLSYDSAFSYSVSETYNLFKPVLRAPTPPPP